MVGGLIMNANQKNYKIILKTHAPIHIGSGKTISKKEYILSRNKQAKIINLEKLAMLIARKNLFNKYENYMCDKNMCDKNDNDLGEWLIKNHISENEIESITNYTLDCHSTAIIGCKKRDINTFMKNPYGKPYVPGSSMKGCLRTILMGYYVKNNPEQYDVIKSDIRNSPLNNSLLKADEELEYITFYTANRKRKTPKDRTNAVNDIMAGIIIGDSNPLKTEKLILCQKCDLRTDGKYSELPIFNECIAPDTQIVLPLTINSELCKITIDEIKEAIKQFAESYYQNYISKFNLPHYKYLNTLWLGGNVGFPNKTVIYNLFGKEEGVKQTAKILTAKSYKNNRNDISHKVSPHTIKMARYNGCEYHMGECTITIKEI